MKRSGIILCYVAMLAACTPDAEQTPKIAASQRQALDKAKAVDAQVQEATQATQRNIDEQSQ